MNPRLSLYFSEETHEKFKEIKSYLKESSALQKQYRNNSATLVTLIEVFYKLFIELGEGKNFYERLTQLEKNFGGSFDSGNDNKAIHRQLDQILYLTLTNFHAITKDDFDVQDLEIDGKNQRCHSRRYCTWSNYQTFSLRYSKW